MKIDFLRWYFLRLNVKKKRKISVVLMLHCIMLEDGCKSIKPIVNQSKISNSIMHERRANLARFVPRTRERGTIITTMGYLHGVAPG